MQYQFFSQEVKHGICLKPTARSYKHLINGCLRTFIRVKNNQEWRQFAENKPETKRSENKPEKKEMARAYFSKTRHGYYKKSTTMESTGIKETRKAKSYVETRHWKGTGRKRHIQGTEEADKTRKDVNVRSWPTSWQWWQAMMMIGLTSIVQYLGKMTPY